MTESNSKSDGGQAHNRNDYDPLREQASEREIKQLDLDSSTHLYKQIDTEKDKVNRNMNKLPDISQHKFK